MSGVSRIPDTVIPGWWWLRTPIITIASKLLRHHMAPASVHRINYRPGVRESGKADQISALPVLESQAGAFSAAMTRYPSPGK